MDWQSFLWGGLGVLVTGLLGWVGLLIQRRAAHASEAREIARDRREIEQSDAKYWLDRPILKPVSLTCTDDEDFGTTLTIKNVGKDSARDVRISVVPLTHFPFTQTMLEILHGGASTEFRCTAKSIHFLNPYVFGRGDVPIKITWITARGESDEWIGQVLAQLPREPMIPVVEPHQWGQLVEDTGYMPHL